VVTIDDMSSSPVEQFGAALADAGLPSLPSRVFSALLMDDDGRMTSVELTECLGVSAAAVSGAVKYLSHLQMIRREREHGSRRDVYVVDDDAWHGMMVRRDRLYAPLLRALDAALDEHRPGDPAYRRIRLSSEFLRYVDEEMAKLAEGWAARRRELEAE
jgi:DNA-binding transcriptional regulator GbsR (MarR family)